MSFWTRREVGIAYYRSYVGLQQRKKVPIACGMCSEGLFAQSFEYRLGGTPARHVYETGELHAEPPRPAYKEGRHVHLRNVDGRHTEGIGSPCMPLSLWGTLPTH